MGKKIALDGSFMQIAAMLWAFDFALDEKVDLHDMVVTGFMTEPKPFTFKLIPRGPWVPGVVEKAFAGLDTDLGHIMGTVAAPRAS